MNRRFLGGVALYAVSLLSIQGTIYLLQFVAAAKMSPADYSVVRIVESIVAIGAQLATFGLPSIALVRVGIARSDEQRRKLIRRALLIVLGLGAITAAGFFVALWCGLLRGQTGDSPLAIVILSALMAFRLLLSAITQSRQHFARLAGMALMACLLAGLAYGSLYIAGGDRMLAWLVARLVLEGTLCIGLITTELGRFAVKTRQESHLRSTGDGTTVLALLLLALPVGGSLIARSLMDNAPVLWLAAMGADAQVVARFGILITMVTVALVLGGVVQGVAVPRLAHSISNGEHRGGYALLFVGLGGVTALGFAALVVISQFILPWGHLLAWDIVVPGCIIVVAKMAASAMGGYLLVVNKGQLILALNGLTVLLGIIAATVLLSLHLPLTLAWLLPILAAIETTAALCYGLVAGSAARGTMGVASRPI
jgi:O-antigen/teichoic acid export membrane protein